MCLCACFGTHVDLVQESIFVFVRDVRPGHGRPRLGVGAPLAQVVQPRRELGQRA